MAQLPASRILGTGSYAPLRVVPNAELERLVDTSDSWISDRTGIRRRHVAAEGETTSQMAAEAARRALAAAGLSPADLDLIIVGTITPDTPSPGCAPLVQRALGVEDIPAFDIAAACAGFLYGLTIADQYIRTGAANVVLVVGVELLTRVVDWNDRSTCVLFGDGAGATIVGAADGDRGLLSTQLFTDGSLGAALEIPGGGTREPYSEEVVELRRNKIKMAGSDVFKAAVRNLTSASTSALKASGLLSSELDWVVAHQANLRIIQQVSNRLAFPMERFILNIDEYGNTSSASIPIALDEAVRGGRVLPGHTVLFCALGAGISWGAAVARM